MSDGVLAKHARSSWALVGLVVVLAVVLIMAPMVGAAPNENRAAGLLSTIEGTSTCPAPHAAWAELRILVGDDQLARRVGAPQGTPPVIQIVDLGESYRVIAAGRVREYRDLRRDCAERARVAAVFVALALAPDDVPAAAIGATPASPSPAASPAAPAASPVEPPPSATVGSPARAAEVELGAAFDAGVSSDPSAVHPGARLALALGRGAFAVTIGVDALASATTSVGGLRLRERRLPASLGARARARWRGVAPYGELGLGATLVSERALDLATPTTDTALELGVYAAVGLRFSTVARLAPYVAAHAQFVPSPAAISALPRGVVGHTPNLWLGATAGASVGF